MPRPTGKNPTTAEAFQGLRADYQATKSSQYRRRRSGLIATGANADWHYRVEADYLRLMEACRDMDRNDVLIGQAVDRAVTNTIQDGMLPDPSTTDRGVNREISARWENWSEDPEQCDIQGELTFHDLENLIYRETLVDGDIISLPRREGCLQTFEAHRLRTPTNTKKNVVHGVLLDDNRKRLEYWFTKDDIPPYQALNNVGETVSVPVRDKDGYRQVFHVRNPKRVTQTRGIGALVPTFDCAGMFEDINFAKLVQQQVVSCFAVFRKRDASFSMPDGTQPTGEKTVQNLPDGSTRTLRGIAPGMEIEGMPGETLEGFSPNVPNAEFFDHCRLILTLIGINLGLPLVLMLLDASETNFSGFRGAVDQARLGFRRNQRWLINGFHRPCYQWKVRQWLADDAALRSAAGKLGDKIFAHTWRRPSWPYIEPLKDASTDLLRVRNALISPRRLHAERGREWSHVCREIVEDNAMAIIRAKRMAAKINLKYTDDQPVHWREVLSLPTPDGVQVSLAPESANGAGSEDVAPKKKDKPKPPARNPKNAL